MSTNTKGFRSELKNRESPSPFRFTPAYNRITSPPNNYDRENHDMGQREELDPSDSINDREMTPEKEILDDQFRTPNAFSRIKAYNQVENPVSCFSYLFLAIRRRNSKRKHGRHYYPKKDV